MVPDIICSQRFRPGCRATPWICRYDQTGMGEGSLTPIEVNHALLANRKGGTGRIATHFWEVELVRLGWQHPVLAWLV